MSLSLQRALTASASLSARARAVARHAAWLAFARLGSQVLMIVLTGLVARRLGSSGLGQFAFMSAILWVANTLSTFGTDTHIIRRLRSEKDRSLLSSSLLIQLALSGMIIAAAFTTQIGEFARSVELQAAWRVFALTLIPLAFYGVLSAALRAYEQMGAYMLLSLAVSFLQLLGVAIALRASGSLLSLAFAVLIAQTASAALAAALCHSQIRGFRLPLRTSWRQAFAALKASWPLALLGVLTILYQRLGVILVGLVAAPAATGWFAAAARVVEASKIAHFSLSGALLPVLGRSRRDPMAAASRQTYATTWKALTGLSIAAAASLTLLAAPLSRLLFGDGFGPTAGALRVLAWGLIPFSLNAYFSLAHIADGTEGPALAALTTGIVAYALLAVLWIPRSELMGPCWAAVIAEWSQVGVYWIDRRWVRRPTILAGAAGEG